jgi:hypothetical protein
MLLKDYDSRQQVFIEKKIDGCESQGACHQDELIGGEMLVIK